jgi:hypothetical protein
MVGFSSLPAHDGELPVPVHQPGDEHCGVGGPPKLGPPRYRCCRCGLWYHWTGSMWRPQRPSAHWLREHCSFGVLGSSSLDALLVQRTDAGRTLQAFIMNRRSKVAKTAGWRTSFLVLQKGSLVIRQSVEVLQS